MKKLLIALLAILLFGLSFGVGYYFATRETEPIIASTIILDINPSIKIDLDKDDNVLFVTPLNEDAKDLVTDDMVGKKVTETVNQISDNLIERRYGEGDLVILVSSKDKTKADLVKETLTESLKGKEVEARVVSYVIKKDATEEEGISVGKAALIEEITNNSGLTVEELKDKSISELLSYEENLEEPVIDTPEETPTNTNTTTNSGNNNGGSSSESSSSCNPPSELKDVAWCDWNSKRHVNCEYTLDEVEIDTIRNQALSQYNITNLYSLYSQFGTNAVYRGASYCIAIKYVITTPTQRITSYWDSHTGAFLKDEIQAVPTFIWTEEQAMQKGLEYYSLDRNECYQCWVSTGTDREGGDWYYRYQVNMVMNDKNGYSVDFNAVTGKVESHRTWYNG